MKRVLKLIQNMKLRNKMLLIFILSVFIPVVVTNILFYNITTTNVKNQKIQDITQTIDQIGKDFSDQIDAAVGISSVLYSDSLLNEYLERDYQSQVQYVENYQLYIKPVIEKYSPVYTNIESITMYSNNETIVYGGYVLPISEEIQKRNWYKKMDKNQSMNLLIEKTIDQSKVKGSQTEVISVIRKIDSGGRKNNDKRFLKINLLYNFLEQTFSKTTLQGTVYLLKNGKIQYSTNSDEYNNEYDTLISDLKDKIVIKRGYQNIPYLNEWEIVGVFQEKEVLQEVRKSREFVFYLAMINLVIPSLILILFTKSLIQRLNRIVRHMKSVENQTFEIIDSDKRIDEIGLLTTEFNRMTLTIKKLIHDVYKADIQKKELELKRNQAQLKALQSQVNPHFLFNSLNTIRMRSILKGEKETASIIKNMATIFRKSINWEKDMVTVKEELDLVVSFLEIQKYRFGEKLSYTIDMPDSLERVIIPKMTLQTLVENASIHGIEPLKKSGLINVTVRKSESQIILSVKDNGVGISSSRIRNLYTELERNSEIGESVGIKNIYYRLKLYYGDKFDFLINSQHGEGTEVQIVIEISD